MTYVHVYLFRWVFLNYELSAALVAQPRPIQYSICIWGNAHVWDWGGRVVTPNVTLIVRLSYF